MAKVTYKVIHAFLPTHYRKPELGLVEIVPKLHKILLVARLLGQLQSLFELLLTFFVVFLGARNHTQLQEPLHLPLLVLHFLRKFQILLNKDFHFVFVFAQVFCSDSADVADRQRLPTQIGHLDGEFEGVLEVVNAIFLVGQSVIAEPEIDRSQELSIDICKLLVKMMVLNGLFGEFAVLLSKKLVIDSYTVISQGLSMSVIDAFTDLQKLQIVLDRFFVLFYVVV